MKFRPIAEPKSRDSIRSATAQNRGSGRGASWLDGPSAAFLYKVKSRALQRAGGYSLSTVVRNRPASSVPIELPLGSSERYISYIYIYLFIYAIKAVTTHFTVLSAGKLCEAYIAGQRRPKECRALLLYQSSAHISGHLRWMMDDGWLISHHQKASEVDSFLRRHDVP